MSTKCLIDGGMLILPTDRLRKFDHVVISDSITPSDIQSLVASSTELYLIDHLDRDEVVYLAKVETWIDDEDTRKQLDGSQRSDLQHILLSANGVA
jgi:hypothetical protein